MFEGQHLRGLDSTKIVTFMKNGFWGTLHEARTDVSMLLGLIFLLIVGGGTLALVFVGESFSVSDCSASVHFAPVLTANRVGFNEIGTAADGVVPWQLGARLQYSSLRQRRTISVVGKIAIYVRKFDFQILGFVF